MSSKPALLPLSSLEMQLSTVDLLVAMFYKEGEVTQLNPLDTEKLRAYIDNPAKAPSSLPSTLILDMNVEVDDERSLELQIKIPLYGAFTSSYHDEPPLPLYHLRCPPWLNRKAHEELVQSMPVDDPDGVMVVVEHLKEAASFILAAQAEVSRQISPKMQDIQLIRVWLVLTSLSTRSKRDDMVNWAPSYSLTGFVLAGKPGILCLEGTSENIDSYMSEIKTKSWSDVPSHQKKVSEKLREEGEDVKRAFKDMREVTDDISKGGYRGNRQEMGEVKKLFEDHGLGGVFGDVLGL
jgi:hypothetical protein